MDEAQLVGRNSIYLRRKAYQFFAGKHPDAYEQAIGWYQASTWEVRSFALGILGRLAGQDRRALDFLYQHCGNDPAWQVNEALAVAFDDYCAAVGYEWAIPQPYLHRAVSEGLRPWVSSNRQYFVTHPQAAIDLLGLLKDDESRYVQASVGNAWRDISRKHFDLVLAALKAWLTAAPHSKARRVVAKFALEIAVKTDPSLRQLYEN